MTSRVLQSGRDMGGREGGREGCVVQGEAVPGDPDGREIMLNQPGQNRTMHNNTH